MHPIPNDIVSTGWGMRWMRDSSIAFVTFSLSSISWINCPNYNFISMPNSQSTPIKHESISKLFSIRYASFHVSSVNSLSTYSSKNQSKLVCIENAIKIIIKYVCGPYFIEHTKYHRNRIELFSVISAYTCRHGHVPPKFNTWKYRMSTKIHRNVFSESGENRWI